MNVMAVLFGTVGVAIAAIGWRAYRDHAELMRLKRRDNMARAINF